MFQNMKVDVIYYKTNTDFEMEFNLCGCCRMRLLTDKAPDRKTAVYALSRSVTRSKIIITVGPLFAEDGVIATIASAIGSGLVTADNAKYAINSTSEIKIIEGSVPLVTSDGFFGGLIIERGHQTMILLTESKSVRKTVMQELIHPYIAEIYAEELKGNGEMPHFAADTAEQPITEEAPVDSEETVEEPKEDISDDKVSAISAVAGVEDVVDAAISGVAPEVISAVGVAGAVKVADVAADAAATVLSDVAPSEAVEEKTKVELDEQSLLVAENDFLAEYDPDSAFILDEADDEESQDDEYVLLDEDELAESGDEDIELLGETEENTDEFNMGAEIELVTENEVEDSPIPIEITELLLDEEESLVITPDDFDIPKGLVTEEEEIEGDFHLPEEQRTLLNDIEPQEENAEPIKQHMWVEGEDEDFIMEENVGERKISKLNVPILIFSLILLFILAVIIYFMFLVPIRGGGSPSEFIKEIFDTLFG